MIPQSYPLYATVKPGEDGDDNVWAVIAWQAPDLPGDPLRAYLVALGAGEFCGAQQTAVPDMVWPTIGEAEDFLDERQRTTAQQRPDDPPTQMPIPDWVNPDDVEISDDIDDDQPPSVGNGSRR